MADDRQAFHPCWHCHHFAKWLYGGINYVECAHPRLSKVKSDPQDGCAFWEREPGADDEPGPVRERIMFATWWSENRGPGNRR